MNLCQDVITLIIKLAPFNIKYICLTNKQFYHAYQSLNRGEKEGNYILTDIQKKIINYMMQHIQDLPFKTNSLVIQAQLSVGKTAAVLAFAISKVKETVVIQVPSSIIPQWYNEIIKMYGSNAFEEKRISIAYTKYTTNKYMNQFRASNYNPNQFNLKVLIVSSFIKLNVSELTKHSIVIIDEIHTKNFLGNEPRVIGVTASKLNYTCKADLKIYTEEEQLPKLNYKDVTCFDHRKLTNKINEIKAEVKGPYLLICSKHILYHINFNYIHYNKTVTNLNQINTMDDNDMAYICPETNSTGINLTNIGCVIFLYPTHHMRNTVIQAIGRVRRATSKNKEIVVYNVHETVQDIIYNHSCVDENDILKFCQMHQLTLIKHHREKYKTLTLIKNLINESNFNMVNNIPGIYFILYERMSKKQFSFLVNEFSDLLGVKTHKIHDILY